jgi:hypothetical protein
MLRSLRSRILLLALLVCVLLASALTGFFLLLRQTQSALTTDAASNLLGIVNAFANDYLNAVRSHPVEGLSSLTLNPGGGSRRPSQWIHHQRSASRSGN